MRFLSGSRMNRSTAGTKNSSAISSSTSRNTRMPLRVLWYERWNAAQLASLERLMNSRLQKTRDHADWKAKCGTRSDAARTVLRAAPYFNGAQRASLLAQSAAPPALDAES